MIKKYTYLVTLVLLHFSSLKSQTYTNHRMWTMANNDFTNDIKQTLDGGFIVCEESHFFGGSIPTSLVKLNTIGGVMWQKSYNMNDSYTKSWETQQTADKGYVLYGFYSFGSTNTDDDGMITKVDSIGNLQWSKKIGGDDNDWFLSGQQTTDGGYIVAGWTTSFGSGGTDTYNNLTTDVYLVKLKSNGSIGWTKTYGNTDLGEGAYYVRQANDGGFIIAGKSDTYNAGGALLIKADALGNIQWSKKYSVPDPDNGYQSGYFSSVQLTSDNGFVMIGSIYSSNANWSYDAWVVKVNSGGDLLWSKTYDAGQQESGNEIFPTVDGGYIIGADGNSDSWKKYENYLLIKTDNNGNVQWSRYPSSEIFINNPEFFGSLTPVAAGGYAIIGTTYQIFDESNSNNNDAYFAKLDADGNDGSCQLNPLTTISTPTVIVSNVTLSVGNGGTSTNSNATQNTYTIKDTIMCNSAKVVASFYASSSCIGDSTSFSNSSNGATFLWDFGDPSSGSNNNSTLINPKHFYNSEGTYTITLRATDGGGSMFDIDTGYVTILPTKFINSGVNISICSGDSTLLSASGTWASTGGYFISWKPGTSVRDSQYVSSTYALPTVTTSYIAKANNGGCYDSTSFLVSVVSKPIFSISPNITICEGTTTTLTTSGNYNYLWSTGDTSNSIAVSPIFSTSYSITASYLYCNAYSSIKIAVLPSYSVNAGDNVTIVKGKGIKLQGTASGAINWFPATNLDCISCPTPFATPTATTTYYLASENTNNKCSSIDSIIVYVSNCGSTLFVPNVFSPNGDGKNDSLGVFGSNCIQSLVFTIYDRWGEKVFESASLNNSWDGTFKNKPLNKDIFVYYLKAVLFTSDIVEKKGNISLIR